MQPHKDHRKIKAIIGIISVILLFGVGIFFYHNFFRQTNAKLIETIPTDASFIFQINDNDAFVKTSTSLLPYLTELLSMSALPGLEYLVELFPVKKNEVMISCHTTGDGNALLLSAHIKESEFKTFLNDLRIDIRNSILFDKVNIYTYGTHLKKFYFAYHNNVISISEDIELLKKSITQLKHPRNFLTDKEFNLIYQLIAKNEKRNFILLNRERYFERGNMLLSEKHQYFSEPIAELSAWSAYQVRFSDREIILSGYMMNNSLFFQKFKGEYPVEEYPEKIIPFNSFFYIDINTPNPEEFQHFFAQQSSEKLKQEATHFARLNPLSTTYFTLTKDTAIHYYLACRIDTPLTMLPEIFPDSLPANHVTSYKQYKIYQTTLADFNSLFSQFHKNVSMNYFTEYQGYYIFSDAIKTLEYYLSQVTSNTFNSQPLYKFIKANLPSENNFEFSMIFPEKSNYLRQYLSPEALVSNTYTGIQAFSYSFSATDGKFIPVNVYFRFK